MKVVILAGGLGSRLAEESDERPKPMVEIGGQPILWHIMKIYSSYGLNDFVICCGYKGYVIKEYFANYYLHRSDTTFDLKNNTLEIHNSYSEPWRVTVVDTGLHTMTGGRIKRALPYLGGETFCLTYGDGLANISIPSLLERHRVSNSLVTITAVQPMGRFGALQLDESDKVHEFVEKPPGDGQYINGGFFVVEPKALDYVSSDDITWEQQPLRSLASDGELSAYIHNGFWQPMDTLRDKRVLEELWSSGTAPWKNW